MTYRTTHLIVEALGGVQRLKSTQHIIYDGEKMVTPVMIIIRFYRAVAMLCFVQCEVLCFDRIKKKNLTELSFGAQAVKSYTKRQAISIHSKVLIRGKAWPVVVFKGS